MANTKSADEKQAPSARSLASAMYCTQKSLPGRLARLAAAGYVIVPLEPTLDMIAAGMDVEMPSSGMADEATELVWRAMVGARP